MAYCGWANFISAGLRVVPSLFSREDRARWEIELFIYLAQTVSATTSVFTMAASTNLSKLWFPQSERTWSTGITYGSYNIGSAMAFLLPNLLVNCGES